MDRIKSSLGEIRKWLTINASGIEESLNSPATFENLYKLTKYYQKKIPPELKKLYQNVNGINDEKMSNFVYGFTFFSTDVVIEYAKHLNKIKFDKFRYASPGFFPEFSPEYIRIPIGHDSSRCYIFCDLSPTNEGTVGQIVFCDFEWDIAIKLADSVDSMLSEFSRDLHDNNYYLAEDALEDGVHWLQPVRSKDIGNWYNSPTWEHLNEKIGLRQT